MWKKQKVTVKLSVSVGDHVTLKAAKFNAQKQLQMGYGTPLVTVGAELAVMSLVAVMCSSDALVVGMIDKGTVSKNTVNIRKICFAHCFVY